MSKTIKHRKRLTLETQTLRVLSSDQLAGAAGGAHGADSMPQQCYPTMRRWCQDQPA